MQENKTVHINLSIIRVLICTEVYRYIGIINLCQSKYRENPCLNCLLSIHVAPLDAIDPLSHLTLSDNISQERIL